jgi:hypothetical protein
MMPCLSLDAIKYFSSFLYDAPCSMSKQMKCVMVAINSLMQKNMCKVVAKYSDANHSDILLI